MTLGAFRRTAALRFIWGAAGALTMAALLASTPGASAATTPPSPVAGSPVAPASDTGIKGQIPEIGNDGPALRLKVSAFRVSAAGETPVPVDSVTIKAGLDQPDRVLPASIGLKDNGRRSIILALDISGSMTTNNLIQPEIDAAKQFINIIEGKNIAVGIVTFGDKAEVLVHPRTTDLDLIKKQIDELKAKDNRTHMFDAVTVAAHELGPTGSRSIFMISDGVDDSKDSNQALKRARASLGTNTNVNRIDFTGILLKKTTKQDIYQIDEPSSVLPASSDRSQLQAQLEQRIKETAQRITEAIAVTATVPTEWLGRSVNFAVTGTAESQSFTVPLFTIPLSTASTPTTSSKTAVAPVVERQTAVPPWVLAIALAAVFAALVVLLATATGGLSTGNDGESAVIRRLEIYSVSGGAPSRVAVTEQTTKLGDSALTRSAVGLMTRIARKGQVDRALDAQLESAGMPIRTAEWMLLHLGIAVASALLLLVISGGKLAALAIGLLIGLAGPWLFLGLARSRRQSKFLSQLPDTLQLLAGSLAAGYSLPQAMDSVVRESGSPINFEFNRALVEARLGMLPEDALDGIARRTESTDFSWIVMAIRIQRDVGGNLAELLSSVAGTLRERERLRRQVSALSAEGRLSGLILGALPLVFGLYLMLTKPDYIAPLFDTRMGLFLLAVGTVLMVVGGFWMSKVIKVKV